MTTDNANRLELARISPEMTHEEVSFPPKTGPLFWHGKGICDGSETAFGRGHTEASAGD